MSNTDFQDQLPANAAPMGLSQLSVKDLLNQKTVNDKFKEILGAKAPGFITSLLQVVNGSDKLQLCNPVSIYTAGLTAAALDLPVVPGLGFAWIVPYNGQAQFQIGYKGFVQLGLRTAQYRRINVLTVYANQFKKWDGMREELEADFTIDGEGAIKGYVAYFQLVNGFEKTIFWSHEKTLRHAKKYSKSFENPKGQWKNNFDDMATKTVLKHALSRWGILSVEMQKAMRVDQAVILTEDAESVQYIDNIETGEDMAARASNATTEAIKSVQIKAQGGAV